MEQKSDLLHEHRTRIDLVDSRLLRLLNERAKLAGELAAIKRSSGLPVYGASKERAIVNRACGLNRGPLDSSGPSGIFRRIIRESPRVEEDAMRPAQGSNG
jgi:chorismate mutase/prephenate dehydratase